MKKVILAACMLLAVTSLTTKANAQSSHQHGAGGTPSTPAASVPHRILTQFHSSYPGATNVQWEVLPQYYGGAVYQAKFTLNGVVVKANFI